MQNAETKSLASVHQRRTQATSTTCVILKIIPYAVSAYLNSSIP